MPVLSPTLPDPGDALIPGGWLAYVSPPFIPQDAWPSPMMQGPCVEPPPLSAVLSPFASVPFPDPIVRGARVRTSLAVPLQNAGICTPCGAFIETWLAGAPIMGAPAQSATRWVIAGTSRDANDVPLPGCRVIVLEVGRLAIGEAPVVAEAISGVVDGTFSIDVPGPRFYTIIAYKPGDAPTVAGITLFPLTPTSVG